MSKLKVNVTFNGVSVTVPCGPRLGGSEQVTVLDVIERAKKGFTGINKPLPDVKRTKLYYFVFIIIDLLILLLV
jgi:hypothetical protein